MSGYERHRAKRARRIVARDRRLQRETGSRIESPVKVAATCSGCLRDIPIRAALFRRGPETYCSADCLVAGKHWVDPSLCGGCHGAHRMGIRPGSVQEANIELDNVFGGEDGVSPIRFGEEES